MAVLPLLGIAASAGGSILSGVSSGMAAQYQAGVARQNAKIEQQNQQRAAMATSSQTLEAGLKARAEDANVKAALAANGVDVNSGSAVGVETSQRELGAYDVANTAERGALATYGYATQATSDEAQANIESAEAPFDYAGGILKGAGSILSGAPQVPGLYSWMNPNSNGGAAPAGSYPGAGGPTNLITNGNVLD